MKNSATYTYDIDPADPAAKDFENWGPYLVFGTDAGTEITISWKQSQPTKNSWICYGTTPACENKLGHETDTPMRFHSFKLTQLIPAARYYYKISRDPDIQFVFTMASPINTKGPFEFIVFSDIHASPDHSVRRTFDNMLALAPNHNFSLSLGDLIHDKGDAEGEQNAFFFDGREFLSQKPLMGSAGNHDTVPIESYSQFLQIFPYPYVDTEGGAYYLMEYGNGVFFFLDTDNAGHFSPAPLDTQYEWLEENLEKYAGTGRWLFICLHRQVYSSGSSGSILNNIINPLCEEYHVDAVFYGHIHHYEAFWANKDADYGGTLYFNAGTCCGPQRLNHNVLEDQEGKNKYIWPSRVLNIRNDGVPPAGSKVDSASRTVDLLLKNQLLGVLEPSFLQVRLEDDMMEIKVFGWTRQLLHHIRVKRAGTGRKFSKNSEIFCINSL